MNDFINAMLFVVLAGSLGVSCDQHDEYKSKSTADAQKQARSTYLKEIAEAQMCRELHGESQLAHNADGDPVCIPRGYIRRKTQVAIR